MKKPDTSWEPFAEWYDEHLQGPGTYHSDVVLPNLLRILNLKNEEKILDCACGQGFFSRAFSEAGASVTGVDASKSLIALAEKQSSKEIEFRVAPSDSMPFLKDASFDAAAIILAIQNIENLSGTLSECARIIKPGGRIAIVMNHPAFRIPKKSSWGWDEKEKLQYRRIDEYLTESKAKIEMHPGKGSGKSSLSFHRPLQSYFKQLSKHGFLVRRLEEWISNKKSQPGLRAKAENKARHEIPLFLCIEGVKMSA